MKTKTSLEVIQELLSIHTSRIEMVEKCSGKDLSEDTKMKLSSAKQQSEKYTKALMIELSKFGDAVSSTVDNQNEYQEMYKGVLGKFDGMTPQEIEHAFQSLETALKNIYQNILQTQTDLPTSAQEILVKQNSGIKMK